MVLEFSNEGIEVYVRASICVLLIVLVSGCAIGRDTSAHPTTVERQCGPAAPVHPSISGLPSHINPKTASPALDPAVLAGRVSPQSQRVAESLKVKDLLVQLIALEAQGIQDVSSSLSRLQIEQQLSNRILLAFLDVARTAAEADCEEERADQLADGLQEIRDQRIRRYTLIAIVGDAMIGIVSGGLGLALQATASEAVAILGGSVATWFGLGAFFDDTRYEFHHTRNLLQDLWIGPQESTLIPTTVWRHLTRPLSGDPQQYSLRESLILRWRQDGRLGEVGSEREQRRIALFFGDGGSYDIEDLRARAAMLDLLEADINLMSQDLEQLLEEILFQNGS